MTTATDLDALLELQERDTALDRLHHRRATLPEREALARGQATVHELDARLTAVRAERDTVAREEQRLDDEARSIAAKSDEVEKQLYSGTIGSPRELQAMQADVEQLRRHQRSIEDRELELMEQREPLDATITAVEAQRASITTDLDRNRVTLSDAESVIDAEIAGERARRDSIVAGIDAGLIAEYERCRARAQGVGAARLVGTTCQGCHLSIPAVEAERIKRSAGMPVAHCDNCGVILVP